MRYFPNLLSSQYLLVVLGLWEYAFAVPWAGNSNQLRPGQHGHEANQPPSHKIGNVFPQLTWLRDSAIEKVFGIPPKSKKSQSHKSESFPRSSRSRLPSTLRAKYGGDIVLRFNISTSEEETALSEAADILFLDVWEFTNNWADIRLREDDVPSLLELLPSSLHKTYSHLMPDLARTIHQSYPSIAFAEPAFPQSHTDHAFTLTLRKAKGSVDNIFFREYQPLSVIVPWMRLMASMFTTHVRIVNIGVSYEGRDILALRVGVHPTNPQEPKEPRNTIIVTGGIHAREWISVSTVTYIAWSLITSYGKSLGVTKLLQNFDWVFIPVLNVDGYVYTWENDRLWRKNRQQTSLRFCRGVDLDRAFGFEWDGTSFQSNPCSESYPGDEPFQAVESHRLAEWAKNETEQNNVKFVGFLDLHSYSQQVLYPYSYSCLAPPPSLENLEELGMGLAKAIRISSGELYGVTSACEGSVSPLPSQLSGASGGPIARIETGGGSAIDWFYHEMHVRYSYQIKLRDTGSYGYLLPSENIVPTGEEAFNAIKYFGKFLLGNKGIESELFEELNQSDIDVNQLPKQAAKSDAQGNSDLNPDDEGETSQELRRR